MTMSGTWRFFKDIPVWPFPRGRANHHVSLADACRSRGDWANAAASYRKALQVDPLRRPIWVQLGHALKEAGQPDQALDAYRNGSALPGSDGDAPLHMGLLARQLGDMAGAARGIVQTLDEQPGHALARTIFQELTGADFQTGEGGYERKIPGQVRHLIVKEMTLRSGDDTALLVTHAPAGRLKPHVLPYIRQLSGAGLQVLLIVVVDRPLELLDQERALPAGIIVRDNGGYDFGAWADGLHLCPSLFGAGLLVMTNDSVIPTASTDAFRAMMDRVRSCPSDIVGLTASHEYGWHVQSYFQAFRPKALSSWAFQNFIRDIERFDNKDKVVRAYEVPFAARMRAAGLTVKTLFSGSYSHNPTFFSWRELIEQGFPFIKLLILRKAFEEIAPYPDVLRDLHEHWEDVAGKAGFDVDLIRRSIRAADVAALPGGAEDGLMVDDRAYERIDGRHTLRVAYIGPWNYDNGLGSASRELLSALRYTDVQLNAHPIARPFHIHRQVCPAVDVLNFAGRPDVAIVHLNPDSWHLLTQEQRAIIRSAKRRIGYWVWETDRLPPTWDKDLHSVDRMWAPSHYCAEVFRAATGLSVDVVPHPVRIPAPIAIDRTMVLRRFGLDPAHRVILYVFDGASYLVRKNPDALVRAFAASALVDRGWNLVLKTKHVHDRPAAGQALIDLVGKTRGAHLLDVSLRADEMAALMAAADIYASPHCSEGFGLTVAEALAMGKSVVATDYSGTQDFLKAEWGYPVPATLWTLEDDHGHYPAGHAWGRIDETALATTLVRAADALAKGDDAKGAAAQQAIARLLSYETVAGTIETSFSTLIDAPLSAAPDRRTARAAVVPPEPSPVYVNLLSGDVFSTLAPVEGVVPVPLASDLSWGGGSMGEGDGDDWLFLAPHDAVVSPDAMQAIRTSARDRPDVVLFYADDMAFEADPLNTIHLKPEFDRTLLVASDYIGAPVFIKRTALGNLGGLDPAQGAAVLYDAILRMAEAGGVIGRIPQVLIGYTGQRPTVDVQARRKALAARGRAQGVELLDGPAPGLLRQHRRFSSQDAPAVSLVIPTRQTLRTGSGQTYVESLLDAIAEVDWPMDRLTVIVGDDVVGEPDWARRSWPFTLRRLETPRDPGEPFNYSRKMNRLWRVAPDEHLVFMNDDARPERTDWLAALLTFSSDESVGGVGARLYYEDGSIQHAGMIPAMRTVVHAWLGWPASARTYRDWAISQREWSMVTGAIFATRRSVLDRVNGFDEAFSLEFNDVDLCLRMRNLGYRIVYNPDAEFTHAEKASRGETLPPGQEVALFLSRWSAWLRVDPSSHPGLTTDRLDPVPATQGAAWYR